MDNEKLVQRWVSLFVFYQNFKTVQSVICVEKGGIPLERYVGRYFGADVLEFLINLGKQLIKIPNIDLVFQKHIKNFDFQKQMSVLESNFKEVADLVSVSEKPIQEMSLEEFAKSFNVELED